MQMGRDDGLSVVTGSFVMSFGIISTEVFRNDSGGYLTEVSAPIKIGIAAMMQNPFHASPVEKVQRGDKKGLHNVATFTAFRSECVQQGAFVATHGDEVCAVDFAGVVAMG
jgi:hypothetical protein